MSLKNPQQGIKLIFLLSLVLSISQDSLLVSCEETPEGDSSTPTPEPITPSETLSSSSPSPPPPGVSSAYDVTSYFEFSEPRPANKLGIFTTTMVHIEFKVDQRVSLWRTNTAYATQEILGAMAELCGTQMKTIYSDVEGDFLHWGNCTFNRNQITALLEQGTGEHWNKNFSYIEVVRKPFRGVKEGVKYNCLLYLDEYKHKNFYLVLMTNTFLEGGGKVSEPIYKLDQYMPFALDFFSDIIDVKKIFQFYPLDFVSQTPMYKCLLGIAFGDSVENLKKVCKFKCKPVVVKNGSSSNGTKDKVGGDGDKNVKKNVDKSGGPPQQREEL